MSLISAMKNVKFNIYGVLLFMLIMIPNFIWFMVKAPNDILRIESITPTIDLIASIFQIIMIIIGLCLFPCLSFLIYGIKIKNWIAIIPTIIFTILHLIYGIINFI